MIQNSYILNSPSVIQKLLNAHLNYHFALQSLTCPCQGNEQIKLKYSDSTRSQFDELNIDLLPWIKIRLDSHVFGGTSITLCESCDLET